ANVLAGGDEGVVRDDGVARLRAVVGRGGRGAGVAADLVVDRVDVPVGVDHLTVSVVVQRVATLDTDVEAVDRGGPRPGDARVRHLTARGRHDRPGGVDDLEVVVTQQGGAVHQLHVHELDASTHAAAEHRGRRGQVVGAQPLGGGQGLVDVLPGKQESAVLGHPLSVHQELDLQ